MYIGTHTHAMCQKQKKGARKATKKFAKSHKLSTLLAKQKKIKNQKNTNLVDTRSSYSIRASPA